MRNANEMGEMRFSPYTGDIVARSHTDLVNADIYVHPNVVAREFGEDVVDEYQTLQAERNTRVQAEIGEATKPLESVVYFGNTNIVDPNRTMDYIPSQELDYTAEEMTEMRTAMMPIRLSNGASGKTQA